LQRNDYLREVAGVLLDNSDLCAAEVHLHERGKFFRCEALRLPQLSFRFDCPAWNRQGGGEAGQAAAVQGDGIFDRLLPFLNGGWSCRQGARFTPAGGLAVGDTGKLICFHAAGAGGSAPRQRVRLESSFRALLYLPVIMDGERLGLLGLKSTRSGSFRAGEVAFYEAVARILGCGFEFRRVQAELRERLKEQSALYQLVQWLHRPGLNRRALLQQVVELLPQALQYQPIASARITFGGQVWTTSHFKTSPQGLEAELRIAGKHRGSVEVFYSESVPEQGQGPFLQEERAFLAAFAQELALFFEKSPARQ
jgi:hypothetical protein